MHTPGGANIAMVWEPLLWPNPLPPSPFLRPCPLPRPPLHDPPSCTLSLITHGGEESREIGSCGLQALGTGSLGFLLCPRDWSHSFIPDGNLGPEQAPPCTLPHSLFCTVTEETWKSHFCHSVNMSFVSLGLPSSVLHCGWYWNHTSYSSKLHLSAL